MHRTAQDLISCIELEARLTLFSRLAVLLGLVYPLLLLAEKQPPRFEDYPVTEMWHGPVVPVSIQSRAERTYRTRLTTASKQPPNFAGHYRFTMWGCGSNCITGAVIDLATGQVIPLPPDGSHAYFSICQSAFEDSGVECHLDSRLMVMKCGLNYIERLKKNVPDVYYFVLDDNHFRQLQEKFK